MSQADTFDPLAAALAASGSAEEAAARSTQAYDSIACGSTGVVIFGAGQLGQILLAAAAKAGLDVLAICDNDPRKIGGTISGVPVLSPADAVMRFNGRGTYLVGIFNSSAPRSQLRRLGCNRIVPFPAFYWRFQENFEITVGLELPQRILADEAEIRRGYALLSDRKSRDEFAAQIRWRLTLDDECLEPPSRGGNIYVDPELIHLGSNEVLVDCGAFDGDSIRILMGAAQAAFSKIYAIEPDFTNRAALERSFRGLIEDGILTVLPFAVGDETATFGFHATGTAASRIAPDERAAEVESRRLDEIFTGVNPTFIKMDIEGAEVKALHGARDTIRRARPVLAVCAYHQCQHLWKIPAIISEILPEYSIFLRRYAEGCWELVYYAIPPERLRTEPVR